MIKISVQLTLVLLLTMVASAQSTRPTLELLDRGMQELYQDVQGSLVRVVVPLQISPRLTDLQHPLQAERARFTIDQCQHLNPVGALKLGIFVKLVEHL